MSEFEKRIRDIADKGELTYLSLCPVAGGWSASFSPASSFGGFMANADDPVDALNKVLDEGMPKGRKRRAAVGEPEPALEREPWDVVA